MNNINLQIEHLKPSELTPYAYNARTHSEVQIAQIISSIQEFGFVNPILLGDDNVIIAGHGRLAAALKIGMETVPVIRLSHLSEAQRRALVLADNKIAENAGWDEELLKQELSALDELDFDLSIAGFSDDEINQILFSEGKENEGLTDEDTTPELPITPTAKLGDIWVCGDHKVICGDSTMIDTYKSLLGDELADMVFTDPP